MAKLSKAQQHLKDQFDSGRRIEVVGATDSNAGVYRFSDNAELCRHNTFWNLIQAIYGNTRLGKNERKLYFTDKQA